jgi:hypothetical protein
MPVGEHSTSLQSHMTPVGSIPKNEGEMNRCQSRSFIMSDDVTSMDIICGTNAVAYNHPGKKEMMCKSFSINTFLFFYDNS